MKAGVKRLGISPSMLAHVMENNTAWRVTKGVPPGSKFVGITVDPYTQIIYLFIEHQDFDLVNIETEVAPQLETLFKKIQ